MSSYDTALCARDRVPEMGHRGVPEMGHQSHPVMSRYRYIRPRPTTGTYIDSLYHGKIKGGAPPGPALGVVRPPNGRA